MITRNTLTFNEACNPQISEPENESLREVALSPSLM